jgi:hypothetical protein
MGFFSKRGLKDFEVGRGAIRMYITSPKGTRLVVTGGKGGEVGPL